MNTSIDTETLNGLGLSMQQSTRPRNSLGQEDFMRLMITQIRNQDPFKPLENGEFIAQMAQFGTMSGIEELKNSVTKLTSSLVSEQSLQAASLIGHSVRAQTNNTLLSSSTESIKGGVIMPVAGHSAVVSVYDAAGNLIKRLQLADEHSPILEFVWDGTDEKGARSAPGRYYFTAETLVGDRNQAAGILIESKITSIGLGDVREGVIHLRLDNGDELDFKHVRQIL